jgi:hypothetical protein
MAIISWTEESHGKPRAEYLMPQLRFGLLLPKCKPKTSLLTNILCLFSTIYNKMRQHFYNLKFHSLCFTKRQIKAVFLINVYNVLKVCPLLIFVCRLETVHILLLILLALNITSFFLADKHRLLITPVFRDNLFAL